MDKQFLKNKWSSLARSQESANEHSRLLYEFSRNLHIMMLESQKSEKALNLLVTGERYWALFYMPLYTLLYNLLNVLVKIVNKMGLQKSYLE
jgi:hypothetical protein